MRRPAGSNGFFDGPLDGANATPRPDDRIRNDDTPNLARGIGAIRIYQPVGL
jgi:hypothetical protein